MHHRFSLPILCLCAVSLAGIAEDIRYGVSWKLIEDEVADYDLPCERLGDAKGLTVSSFDGVFPWSEIKLCKLVRLADGKVRICYAGEPDFSAPGVQGDIMVEIPKHYASREVRDGRELRWISKSMQQGFYVDPAFIEKGRELDYIYVGAYEAHISTDGRMQSVSGVYPTSDLNRVQYRECARKNGAGFGTFDLRTLLMLQNLFLVEHADRNSQRALGNGWGKMLQPHRTHRCVRPEAKSNRIITQPAKMPTLDTIENGIFVGGAIQITSYEMSGKVLVTGRTLTSIKLNDPEAGMVSMYFDGAPVDTTSDMCLGGAAQKTGLGDSISGHSGHGEFHGSPPYDAYRCAVKYRHMENLWGNLWCFVDGVNLSGGRAYACDDMAVYASGVTDGAYWPADLKQALQGDNGDIGGPREIHFMKNLGYNAQHPWLALPVDYTYQSETTSPN